MRVTGVFTPVVNLPYSVGEGTEKRADAVHRFDSASLGRLQRRGGPSVNAGWDAPMPPAVLVSTLWNPRA